MACFTGPVAGKIVAAIIRRRMEKNEIGNGSAVPWSVRLKWLENMFLGGSILLAFEHVWHGEIMFSFPFLTAVRNGETVEMLKEIATVGSAMTGVILLVWAGMILTAERLARKEKVHAEA